MPRIAEGARATVIAPAYAHDGDVCFTKKVKKTSWRTMGIPAWFVREHRDDFQTQVGVSFAGSDLLFHVHISFSEINNKDHVAFGRGWKEFAHFHQLREGERLKFSLVKKSHFVVENATD